MTGRLISTLLLLFAAVIPAGLGQAAVRTDDGAVPYFKVQPHETTLSQFTQFTIQGGLLPKGPTTIRLNGQAVMPVRVTDGSLGSMDVPVPPGVATCGRNIVTIDGAVINQIVVQETVTVYCLVLTITPNPVFSAGAPTALDFTGSGFPANRDIALTIDGQALAKGRTSGSGILIGSIPQMALGCGDHQLTATLLPDGPIVRIRSRATLSYPAPALSTTISVLGCASSSPPPEIVADPIETGIDQFTQLSVEGLNLAAGPATIKLRGVTVGTVVVDTDGTFPMTDFPVPAGAAACGQDAVTIDDTAPAIATSTINVYCPALVITPNPVFSGGKAADLSIAGTGFPGDRPVDFAIDGNDIGTVTSDHDGSVTDSVPNITLACGAHQVSATAQPIPEPGFLTRGGTAKQAAAPHDTTVPHDPPIPAAADVMVLGCASSTTPPQIHAHPIETTLSQFTRFSADGSLLPAGPATIKLRGVTAGTVVVDDNGMFRTTDFTVPPHAAICGRNTVTIDDGHGGPTLATTDIAVFCPSISVVPNPLDSGGGPAVMNLAGTGFPPNRAIDLGFDGRTRTIVTSNAAGAVHGSIRGISPACGQHQTTATAHPPTSTTPAAKAEALQAFLPVTASAPVVVVGCARIIANPSVIQQGTLTHVTGTGFLPRTAVTLAWQNPGNTVATACSPNTVSAPTIVTDAAGSIDVYCLAFRNEALGALLIAASQGPERETAPVVVEDGSMQPSNGNQLVFRR